MSTYLKEWCKACKVGTEHLLEKQCQDKIDPSLRNNWQTFDIDKAKKLDDMSLGFLTMEWHFNEQLTNDPEDERIYKILKDELKRRENKK